MPGLELRPSAAFRWSTCTAWPALRAEVQPPETTSSAAREGIRLHRRMEHLVKHGFIEDDCADGDRRVLRDAWRLWGANRLRRRGGLWRPEQRVRVKLGGRACAGTCDAMAYDQAHRALLVVDWKFGRRHRVHARGNPQLALYATGAYLAFRRMVRIDRIESYIIQPRAPDGMRTPPESWTLTVDELREEYRRLDHVAGRIHAGDTEYVPTEENCRWCDCREQCPARLDAADGRHRATLAAAAMMFGAAKDFLNPETT